MHIWAVEYNLASLSEELYQKALRLVDLDAQARIKKFYRREDASREHRSIHIVSVCQRWAHKELSLDDFYLVCSCIKRG